MPFPTKPPYTAHLGNLDYNVTSADIEEFLSDCQVTTVRIMEDKVDRKPKGFGYVEFGSPEGLRAALDKTETPFMGRNIKISVADPRMQNSSLAMSSCTDPSQPRMIAWTHRVTSQTGAAKAHFQISRKTLDSHQEASAEISTTRPTPAASVGDQQAAESLDSSRMTVRYVTSPTGSAKAPCLRFQASQADERAAECERAVHHVERDDQAHRGVRADQMPGRGLHAESSSHVHQSSVCLQQQTWTTSGAQE